METTPINPSGINKLVDAIQQANQYFRNKVQRQVNIALTLRNWVIGCYIFEYEQHGKDRADYGKNLYKTIAKKLKDKGFQSVAERNLYLCKDIYITYPQILQTASAELYFADFKHVKILQTVSAKLISTEPVTNSSQAITNVLLEKLSFSHFIELIKIETSPKRHFYEIEAIKNNWSMRELKRAINSMLYERTGLNTDIQIPLSPSPAPDLKPEEVFRSPYLLEFLGLEENPSYTETDLETAIITHLQAFLLEMGRGFCFEARQKRITFGNTHYRIDLVFYHRILKCHILIDLKTDDFTHADIGQMNVYLNYYREHEVQENDNPPIGIILCAGKDDALVKYATMGLSQKVFVSKYLTNLPTEEELQRVISHERERLTG